MNHDVDKHLDALFAEARERQAPPSPDFAARLLADAADAMPRPRPATPPKRRGIGTQLWDAIGGWRGGFALAGSAMAGLMVGYADLGQLDLIYDTLPGYSADALTLTLDGDLLEG